jgi:two-component system sensor histidine kinase and response regulator WspE
MSDGGNFSMMDLFREEVRAHALTLNQGLLDLENDPANPQKIEPLMRAAHSIKGAARIVNAESAVQLAHVMEDALVAAQEGRLRITPADIDLLLRGSDLLAGLAQVEEEQMAAWSGGHADDLADLKDRFRRMTEGEPAPAAPSPSRSPEREERAAPVVLPAVEIPREPFVIRDEQAMTDLFREELRVATLALGDSLARLEGQAADSAHLEELAQAARSITGAARMVGLEAIARLGQILEELFTAAQDEPGLLATVPADPLREAIALLAEVIRVNDEDLPHWPEVQGTKLADLCERLQGLTRHQPAEPAPTAPLLPAPTTPPPAKTEEPVTGEKAPQVVAEGPAAAEAVVRVTAQSLNRLMGLAGESLVQARWLDPFATALLKLKKQQDHLTAVLDNVKQALAAGRQLDRVETLVAESCRQASVCREVLSERVREFQDHAALAEDLNSRLYREVIASRMRPFADGTGAFPRLVRDMARNLGKQVRLQIDGQATEVDRDILEKLEAPLTHLLRNAVDHGIESAEQRRAAGKPETGLVRIEAHHMAGALVITITDDGSGIELERLRAKVVERRLTTADMAKTLTEPELLEFLFLPGFSTASALTEYSGRGVGLDVVQTMVRQVGGSVRISTQASRGTRFHLQLPITLSVLRAVLVDIAGEPYAFPHNRIDRLLYVPLAAIQSLEQRQFMPVDGENVGLVQASQLLDLPATTPTDDALPVVLLSDQTGKYGLIVEAFRGEQDLVVRPLDPRLGKVPNLSAAAILDDGSPVLIADVEDLIRSMDQFIQGNALRRCGRDEQATGPRKRVLVVDDSITVREVERQLLRNQGYDVAVAVDGQEGWNLARAEPFDLVVSDVDMPRMNGLELVRALRADPGLRNVPVIIISYKEREEDRLRGLEVGANYYLTKSSFHDNTFLQAIADLIGEA